MVYDKSMEDYPPAVVTPAHIKRAWIEFHIRTPEDAEYFTEVFIENMEVFCDEHELDLPLEECENVVFFDSPTGRLYFDEQFVPLPARLVVDTFDWDRGFVEVLTPESLNPASTHQEYAALMRQRATRTQEESKEP